MNKGRIDSNEVELTEHRAIICLPEDSVAVTLHAKVFYEGELIEVSKDYNMREIREMFRKADEGYIDDEDTFVLTEKGTAWLDEQERLGNL